MLGRLSPTVIAPVWLLLFGVLVLLWSPLTLLMGALLLLIAFAGPAAMFLLWKRR